MSETTREYIHKATGRRVVVLHQPLPSDGTALVCLSSVRDQDRPWWVMRDFLEPIPADPEVQGPMPEDEEMAYAEGSEDLIPDRLDHAYSFIVSLLTSLPAGSRLTYEPPTKEDDR